MIIGALIMSFLGIPMVLMDPDTERLVRTTPLSVLPIFVLFVLTWVAIGAFMGGILGAPLGTLLQALLLQCLPGRRSKNAL